MSHRPARLRHRIVRRVPPWMRAPQMPALVIGTLLTFALGLFVLLTMHSAVILIFALLLGAVVEQQRRSAPATPPAPPPAPRPAPAGPAPWADARRRFDELRGAYAAHECDPMAVLAMPALSDVTVPSTARFVDAFAEAQALATDLAPPPSHAAAFVTAVVHAERCWQAARDAADRIRLAHLSPTERSAIERTITLLTLARDTDSDGERLAAYARARTELATLDRAGVVHLPRAAAAVLEAAGRGQLPA